MFQYSNVRQQTAEPLLTYSCIKWNQSNLPFIWIFSKLCSNWQQVSGSWKKKITRISNACMMSGMLGWIICLLKNIFILYVVYMHLVFLIPHNSSSFNVKSDKWKVKQMLIKRIFLPCIVNTNTKLRQFWGKIVPFKRLKQVYFSY
jgi:hypothetical protein